MTPVRKVNCRIVQLKKWRRMKSYWETVWPVRAFVGWNHILDIGPTNHGEKNTPGHVLRFQSKYQKMTSFPRSWSGLFSLSTRAQKVGGLSLISLLKLPNPKRNSILCINKDKMAYTDQVEKLSAGIGPKQN